MTSSQDYPSDVIYRVVKKKGTVLLSTTLAWLRLWLAAARQKLSLNLAPFLLLNPVLFNM